jgi:hypothetical protein|tara:strand:- start:5292 stop:5411 length:120 start_codon:yes stop_codon:yes gene_type:complete
MTRVPGFSFNQVRSRIKPSEQYDDQVSEIVESYEEETEY